MSDDPEIRKTETQNTETSSEQEFGVALPPNARLAVMQLADTARQLSVTFADGGPDRTVKHHR